METRLALGKKGEDGLATAGCFGWLDIDLGERDWKPEPSADKESTFGTRELLLTLARPERFSGLKAEDGGG